MTLDDFLKNLTLFDGTSPISNPQIIPNGDLDGDSNWFWDQYYISSNENVTFDNILDYPPSEKRDIAISWDWDGVSRNPNLTYKDILNNPDKPWNWRDISSNSFDRYNAAVMIQRFYRKHGAFPRWKRVIEDSNMAILYNPKIGGLEFLKEQALVEREFNGE